jgi:hypothetical protein
LFDLKRAAADDIGDAIFGNLSPNKSKAIANRILARHKADKRPAG